MRSGSGYRSRGGDREKLNLFAEGSIATNKTSSTVWRSEDQTSRVEVTNGELVFVALDEEDKRGTTELRITEILGVEGGDYL